MQRYATEKKVLQKNTFLLSNRMECMIVVTVFPSDYEPKNGFPIRVQNLKKNCQHDHIPFKLKGTRNTFLGVRPGFSTQ